MCRLLLVQNSSGFDPQPHLEAFKSLSRESPEFQGHGWGCAWLDHDRKWQVYHNLKPVWEDQIALPETSLFLAHARSAFRDEGIAIENNMPFFDGYNVFIFNGELRGVKIKAEGRIGAEKIFNTIKRFYKNDYESAVSRAVMVLNKRTRYVRALNFIFANQHEIQICSQFAKNPDYFQLRSLNWHGTQIICSQPYAYGDNEWSRINNNQTFGLSAQ